MSPPSIFHQPRHKRDGSWTQRFELQTVTGRLEFDECSDIDLTPLMQKTIGFILTPPGA